MAATIAALVERGVGAAAMIAMLRMDPRGKGLLEQAGALENADDLIAPFKADPECWAILAPHEDKLSAFALDFRDQARGATAK